MVVHGGICGSGCAEGVPVHRCVRFGGSFFGVRAGVLKRRSEERPGLVGRAWAQRGEEEGGGGVGLWESGKLGAAGRRLFVSCG